jgi:glycosyltransferase involved in cell wall biosynthesis
VGLIFVPLSSSRGGDLGSTKNGGQRTNVAWEPPVYEVHEFFRKRTRYCVIVVVLNEGARIQGQLEQMKERAHLADIIVADGRSTDGSTGLDLLKAAGVRALLVTDEPGLCTATRMGVAYAMEENYDGVVTIDGNGKDGVEALPAFLQALDDGYDLVQGSRFMTGGEHRNTPLDRYIGIRFLTAPALALGCGYWYTDPTNGFRAISMRFLRDPRVQPVRRVFVRFNLQLYFICRAAKLGFKVKEIPVKRFYPSDGFIPTKVVGWREKYVIFREMVMTALGAYDPKGSGASEAALEVEPGSGDGRAVRQGDQRRRA